MNSRLVHKSTRGRRSVAAITVLMVGLRLGAPQCLAEIKPPPAVRSVFVILDNTQSMVMAAKMESWNGFAAIYNGLPAYSPVTLLLLEGHGVNKALRAQGSASAIRHKLMEIRKHYLSTEGRGPRQSTALRCGTESRFLDAIRYEVVDAINASGGAKGRYRHEAHIFGDLVEESCDNILETKIDMQSDPTLSQLKAGALRTKAPKWPVGLKVHLHILHDPALAKGPKPDHLEQGWRKLLPLGGFQGGEADLVVTKGR